MGQELCPFQEQQHMTHEQEFVPLINSSEKYDLRIRILNHDLQLVAHSVILHLRVDISNLLLQAYHSGSQAEERS